MDWTGFSQQDSTATQHWLSHFACVAWLHALCRACIDCLLFMLLVADALLGRMLFVAWLPVVCVSWLPVVCVDWLLLFVVLVTWCCL
jgi:hypothetical protein